MARQLKVYGWTGYGHKGAGWTRQTRDIVAAHSVAEVLRLAGMSRRDWEWTGCETGNQREIEVAMSEPGTIFYQGLNASKDEEWRKA